MKLSPGWPWGLHAEMMDEEISMVVTVELSGDEALVLFEWLAGLETAKVAVGEAEQRVLWRIEGALATSLVEPFAMDYAELVEKARGRILAR